MEVLGGGWFLMRKVPLYWGVSDTLSVGRSCSSTLRESWTPAPPSASTRYKGAGLVFKGHRLLCHSTLGLRVIKKKKYFFLEIWISPTFIRVFSRESHETSVALHQRLLPLCISPLRCSLLSCLTINSFPSGNGEVGVELYASVALQKTLTLYTHSFQLLYNRL